MVTRSGKTIIVYLFNWKILNPSQVYDGIKSDCYRIVFGTRKDVRTHVTMISKGEAKVQKVMIQPVNLILRYLQN